MSGSRARRRVRIGGVVAGGALLVCLAGAGSASSSLASGTYGPLIEYWDGVSWTQQPAPNPDGDSSLGAVVAVSATDVWALGDYGLLEHQPSALAEHWDGSAWQQVAMPTPSGATEVHFEQAAAVSATDVWAVGSWAGSSSYETLTEHWNGTRWSIVPSPHPRYGAKLEGVSAISPTNAWAVGYAFGDKYAAQTLVLHWNGSKWKRVQSPHPGVPSRGSYLEGVTALSARNAWAVGSFYYHEPKARGRQHSFQTLVLHWNGKKWTQVRSPSAGGVGHPDYLFAVAATGRNDVWAVGSYGHDGEVPQAVHWNGRSWQSKSAPFVDKPTFDQALTDITAISHGDVWAAGTYLLDNGDIVDQTLAEHWDGGSWTLSPSMNPDFVDGFSGISAAGPNDVWAVGAYYDP